MVIVKLMYNHIPIFLNLLCSIGFRKYTFTCVNLTRSQSHTMGAKQPGQIKEFHHGTSMHHNIQTCLCAHHMSDNISPLAYKHLTDVQVTQCLTLAHSNRTICAIATEVGCSKSMVGWVLTDHNYNTFTT